MDCKEKPDILEMYISSLSDEDREKYKYLIEEYRDRDAKISRDCEEARNNIKRVESIVMDVTTKLKELEATSNRMLKNTATLYLNLTHKKKMHS